LQAAERYKLWLGERLEALGVNFADGGGGNRRALSEGGCSAKRK
jgi:hypothetical protein